MIKPNPITDPTRITLQTVITAPVWLTRYRRTVFAVNIVPSNTGTVVGWNVAVVVKGIGTPLPLWEAVPVLNMVSSPYWFDTVSRKS